MMVKKPLRATAPRLNALRYDDNAASSARRLGPPGRSASRDDNSAVSLADSDAAWPFSGMKLHMAATAAGRMSARRNIAVSIVDRLTRISKGSRRFMRRRVCRRSHKPFGARERLSPWLKRHDVRGEVHDVSISKVGDDRFHRKRIAPIARTALEIVELPCSSTRRMPCQRREQISHSL